MAAIISFLVPSQIDSSNPCCCIDAPITLERYALTTTTTPSGYSVEDTITVRGIDYVVSILLTVSGDQISGTAKFTKIRGNKIVNNLLFRQFTSFPSIPLYNQWDKIYLAGVWDTAIIELRDDATASPPTGSLNRSVTMTVEAMCLVSNTGEVVNRSIKNVSLTGSDTTGWKTNADIKLSLAAYNNSTFQVYELTLLKGALVQLYLRQVIVSGTISTFVQPQGGDKKEVNTKFRSAPTTSDYNIKFPWTNQWSIADTDNPSVSLILPSTIIYFLPSDLRIVWKIKLDGEK